MDKKKQKQIKKFSKNEKSVKMTGFIYESQDLDGKQFAPQFAFKYKADLRGYYKKLLFKGTTGSSYPDNLIGTPIVTLESFDGDIVLSMKYNHGSYEMKFPLFVLGDIVTAAQALNKLNDGRQLSKHKIKIKRSKQIASDIVEE